MPPRERRRVLGAPIDVIDWPTAVGRILGWARARESRFVCLCNVHSVVTARHQPEHARALETADLCTPDGAPVAWALRRLGCDRQQRISGPDLSWHLLEHAEREGLSVYFYGSTPATLDALADRLRKAFPDLKLAGLHAPPFRPLTQQEQAEDLARVRASGAQLVFVGLGCPKQEAWMAQHREQLNAVMLGVGAAFDYHAGTLKRAPLWAQQRGMEWVFRLIADPRRLLRRYLVTNLLFTLGIARQLLETPRSGVPPEAEV